MKFNRLKNTIVTWWKPLAGVAGFVVMIIYAGGMLHKKTPPDHVPAFTGEHLPENASIADVVRQSYPSRIDIPGTTASDHRIQISARISATVRMTHVQAGDEVKKNQMLITLDDRELNEQLSAAEAQLNQAKTEYQRVSRLHEREAATRQNLISAETAYQSAQANAERMRVMLSYTQIKSPMDGVVADRSVEEGDLAGPGQMLLSIYNPDNVRIEVPVPVRLIEKFSTGTEFEVELDHPAGIYTGVVTEISGEINPASRTRLVKLTIGDSSGKLLPGAFGRVWVEDGSHPGIRIPASAMIRVGQLEMVQLVEGNRMKRRLVKTGSIIGDRIEILSGLNEGDRIVTGF